MSRAWKVLLPVAVLMVLAGFAAGAVVRAGADEPPARTPIDLGPAPAGTSTTPTVPATPSEAATPPPAEVITPRPDLDDDRDDDRRGGDDRDDDRRGHDDRDDRGNRDDRGGDDRGGDDHGDGGDDGDDHGDDDD
ncbi:hypothetical protein [Pimelobacter simplex]|uniref:hypothetical protein n=1 Tax=Nocardioides simplex TaxID=2045 RepID=UPI0019332E7E|nr:hypothetical protein [Pimelobacter simplex]